LRAAGFDLMQLDRETFFFPINSDNGNPRLVAKRSTESVLPVALSS